MTNYNYAGLSVPIFSFCCCGMHPYRDYHVAIILFDSLNNKLVGEFINYSENNLKISTFYDTY